MLLFGLYAARNTLLKLYNIIDFLSLKVCSLIVLGAVGSVLIAYYYGFSWHYFNSFTTLRYFLLYSQGWMDFHHDIYRLMTRLFKCKNVPLENFLAKLWESRTTHALCISPVYETLIINLSEQYGDLVSLLISGYAV